MPKSCTVCQQDFHDGDPVYSGCHLGCLSTEQQQEIIADCDKHPHANFNFGVVCLTY